MRIHGGKLEKAMRAKGLDEAALASAIATTPSAQEDAVRAIRNWVAGKDHPRCKAAVIRQMAGALNVRPADLAKFTSEQRYHRGSPRKAKLLVDLIRGKNVTDAENLLTFTTKRAAVDVRRALKAAVTEAEQAEADTTALIVTECRVDNGPVMKRFQPKDRGRAHSILKPYCHITVSVEERTGKR